jgi:hydroxymethylpyrimidine/phosphomethylpyrimidine kinase
VSADEAAHSASSASPRALVIGGFDPSAGAGVLLDAAVVARLGFQPAAAITTVTAQNSAEFVGSWPVEREVLLAQLGALAAEGPFACAKVGAIGSARLAMALASWLADAGIPYVVVDPVLASSSGGELMDGSTAAIDAVASVATVVTPNADETCALWDGCTQMARAVGLEPGPSLKSQVASTVGMPSVFAASAGRALANRWECAVAITGLPSGAPDVAIDVLVEPEAEPESMRHPLVPGVGDVRGTGCMLASSLACHLALGLSARDALASAHADVHELLGEARAIGAGSWQVDLAHLAQPSGGGL